MALGDVTLYVKNIQSLFDSDGGGTLSGTPADLNTDTIKVVVLDNTFTPDTTSSTVQEHFDDVSAKEVATATAYSGPITLTTLAVTEAAGVVKWDADDIVIAADASGFTDARYIAFYKDSGTPSTSPLLAIGDLGSDQDNTVTGVNLTWGAGGIFTITQV